jgi:hypothetical protein
MSARAALSSAVRHHNMRLNLTALHRTASRNLEDALRHYEDPLVGNAREFVDLKLQANIFHYDVCSEMVGYMRNKPVGFPAAVALKGLVLRLYEYDAIANASLIPRLLALAKARRVPFTATNVKTIRDPWRAELKRLRSWANFRNQAAGHYGKNFETQVSLLKQLDPADVMKVTKAFLSFNVAMLHGLALVGRGVSSDA